MRVDVVGPALASRLEALEYQMLWRFTGARNRTVLAGVRRRRRVGMEFHAAAHDVSARCSGSQCWSVLLHVRYESAAIAANASRRQQRERRSVSETAPE